MPAIIEIHSSSGNEKKMKEATKKRTGDNRPFFCPAVIKGKPYVGHVHTDPPCGATNIDYSPIYVD